MLEPTGLYGTESDQRTITLGHSVSEDCAPPPNTVVGYDILGVLGRGGMGIVYKARQSRLDRFVALKMILGGSRADQQTIGRFRGEAAAAARLQHPNIVQIHEIGDSDGQPYFSLEYVEGGSLAQKLAEAPLPPRSAARTVELLARAMAYAHGCKIIHRDLKPANVLLTGDGSPKIADFGLAKQLESDSGHTRTGAIFGTPSYMAPEQASGQSDTGTPSVDIYALGCILYECLTGRPPFRGPTQMATLLQVTSEDPVPPSRLQPEIPRDLETICLKCLEKLPGRRYAGAGELADDLQRYLAGQPITARPVGLVEHGVKWARRKPAVAGLLATIFGLTVAALLVLTAVWQHAQAGWGEAKAEGQKANEALQGVVEERERTSSALVQVKDEKRRTEDALQREEKLRAEADEQRKKFQRQATVLTLDRGIALSEQGNARSLLWFARGLRTVGRDDADLERVLRMNLAAWTREIHPLRFVLSGKGYVGTAYSPDGQTLLTWGYDGVERWDASTGRRIDRLYGDDYIGAAAYSPDGKTIAATTDSGILFLWDAGSGKLRGEPQASLALAAGTVGMMANRGGLRSSLAPIALYPQRAGILQTAGQCRWIAFSPNSRTLASVAVSPSSERFAQLWDVRSGSALCAPIRCSTAYVGTFSPDGQTLITSGSDVRLWNLKGEPIGKPLSASTNITGGLAAVSPDGKTIATGIRNGRLQLWNSRTTEPIGQPQPEFSGVEKIAFHPSQSNVLAVAPGDRTVRFWDPSAGRQLVRTPLNHPRELTHLAFRRDGSVVTADRDSTVRYWRDYVEYPKSGGQVGYGIPHETVIHNSIALSNLVISPLGSSLATTDASLVVRVWNIAERTDAASVWPGRALTVDRTGRKAVVLLPQGKLQVWEQVGREKPTPVGGVFDPAATVNLAALSPDGKTVASYSLANRTLRLWDAETGAARTPSATDKRGMHFIAFSPDGKSLIGTHYQGFTVYDSKTLAVRYATDAYVPGHAFCAAYSPDGTVIAAGGQGGTVKFWEAANGRILDRKLEHRGNIASIAYSADGKLVLTGSADRTARLWHADTGMPARPPLIHPAPVSYAALSPDGKTIVTNDFDGYVQIWDTVTGKPVGPPVNNGGQHYFATFRDNDTVLTGLPTFSREVRVPQLSAVEAERFILYAEVATGLTLEADGTYIPLDGPAWQQRKQRLDKLGGPPQP